MDKKNPENRNGDPNGHPRLGERIDSVGQSARRLADEARGAVDQLADTVDLEGRVQRHPYGMLFAAFGVGYVLGGGLFTSTTARVLKLGMKLAALPLVKDELLGMAEAAVDRVAGARDPGEARGGDGAETTTQGGRT